MVLEDHTFLALGRAAALLSDPERLPGGAGRQLDIEAVHKTASGQDRLDWPIIYDITSFSILSKLLELLEYGHNRNSDGLPHVNLSLIAHKTLGIPLGFQTYHGSIRALAPSRTRWPGSGPHHEPRLLFIGQPCR
jgi:hypothetical protein